MAEGRGGDDAESVPGSCLGKLVLLLVSTGLSLLAGEGITRLAHPVPLHATDTFLVVDDAVQRQADASPRWLRANVETQHEQSEFKVSVKTNSRRLRDVERPMERPPGVRRLLSVGDSFAFGYGVELAEAYCKVAERALGEGWDAINAGVPAWGTVDELDFLVSEGFRYEPSVVALCFYRNDLYDNWVRGTYEVDAGGRVRRVRPLAEDRASPTDFSGVQMDDRLVAAICERSEAPPTEPFGPGPGWWAEHSNLYRLGRQALSRMTQERRVEATRAAMRQAKRDQRRLAAGLLAEVARECRDHEVACAILLMPSREEATRSPQHALRDALRDITDPAERLGARIVDLAPALSRAGVDTVYFSEDRHLNRAGHRVVGRELAAAVREACAEREQTR